MIACYDSLLRFISRSTPPPPFFPFHLWFTSPPAKTNHVAGATRGRSRGARREAGGVQPERVEENTGGHVLGQSAFKNTPNS